MAKLLLNPTFQVAVCVGSAYATFHLSLAKDTTLKKINKVRDDIDIFYNRAVEKENRAAELNKKNYAIMKRIEQLDEGRLWNRLLWDQKLLERMESQRQKPVKPF